MATKTDFLKMTKPGNDGLTDTWDQAVNKNMDYIDEWAAATQNEMNGARGQFTSVGNFLAAGHETDGTNKPSTEVVYSRNSKLYGDSAMVYDHLENIDMETFYARGGFASMQDAMANRTSGFDFPDSVISGAVTNGTAPNFLTASGSDFLINTASRPVVLNVGGYYLRIRSNATVTASGGGIRKYLVATKPSVPVVVSSGTIGAISTNPSNVDKLQLFSSTGANFAASVVAGDVIELFNSNAIGKYIVQEVAPLGNIDQLIIRGLFKSTGSGITFSVYDPFAAQLSIEDTYTAVAGKCIIGEATWDSGSLALSNAVAYAFKGKFESDWMPVDASSLVTAFSQIFDHNIGVIPKRITLLSSANITHPDTGDVYVLSTDVVHDAKTVSVSNPVDGVAILGGYVRGKRGINMKMNRLKITTANPVLGVFFYDFLDNIITSGSLKVICER